MSNPTSLIDFSIPLATFLATAKGDATWAQILSDVKTDRVGYEVPASGCSVAHGQLIANAFDDFLKLVYAQSPGRKDYSLSTIGAVTDEQVLATLGVDGELWRISGIVTGRTATAGEVASAQIGGHFYRSGGTVFPLDVTHTIVEVGLVAVDAELVVATDDVKVLVTGIAGKTITWHTRIDYAEQIS